MVDSRTMGDDMTMWDENWATRAACTATDDLFVRGAEQHVAKRICNGCDVKAACLAEALDHRIEWGVWGGATERERRSLLRRRPEVTAWRELLVHA
jgi:WhiB family redox-sensing transcriptional regulator